MQGIINVVHINLKDKIQKAVEQLIPKFNNFRLIKMLLMVNSYNI